MKRIYKKPILHAHRIEIAGVVCASGINVKNFGLNWSTENDYGTAGAWADSRTWGGTLIDEDENAQMQNNE